MNDDNNKITEHIQSLCFDVPSNVQSVITHNITKRLELGRSRYGHGVIINSDVSQWTENKTNNWIEMAYEEFYDGLIYLSAAYFREKQNNDHNEVHKIIRAMKFLISGIQELS